MSKRTVLGVEVSNRVKNVAKVQKILTDHGCNIKTRLGLHDVGAASCSPSGLLILETRGAAKEIADLEKKLKSVPGVTVKKMVF